MNRQPVSNRIPYSRGLPLHRFHAQREQKSNVEDLDKAGKGGARKPGNCQKGALMIYFIAGRVSAVQKSKYILSYRRGESAV